MADPVAVVERIYERLRLHDFAPLRLRLEAFVREQTAYRANRHKLDAATRDEIRRQWSDSFSRYGYSPNELPPRITDPGSLSI